MASFLLAPTEHELQRLLPQAPISSLPERHGCDVLSLTPKGIIGYQRKTLPDLIASLQDGRLYYELSQIQSSATVSTTFLVIEGPVESRTTDGEVITDVSFPVATLRSISTKFQLANVVVLHTLSTRDTVLALESTTRYLSTDGHELIRRPKQLRNEWGQLSSTQFASHFLQSFPGVGPKLANAIIAHFHQVPISWTVDSTELAKVPGLGKKRAAELIAALSVASRESCNGGTPQQAHPPASTLSSP